MLHQPITAAPDWVRYADSASELDAYREIADPENERGDVYTGYWRHDDVEGTTTGPHGYESCWLTQATLAGIRCESTRETWFIDRDTLDRLHPGWADEQTHIVEGAA